MRSVRGSDCAACLASAHSQMRIPRINQSFCSNLCGILLAFRDALRHHDALVTYDAVFQIDYSNMITCLIILHRVITIHPLATPDVHQAMCRSVSNECSYAIYWLWAFDIHDANTQLDEPEHGHEFEHEYEQAEQNEKCGESVQAECG